MAYDVFIDGFEYPQLRWDNVNAMSVANAGRTGQCVVAYNTFSGCDRIYPNSSHVVLGCAIKIAQLPPDTGSPLFIFQDGTAVQTYLGITPEGRLEVYSNQNLLAISQNRLTVGQWYYLEFGAHISSSGGSVEVRINETSFGWIPLTIANNNVSGNPWINRTSLFYMDPGFNSAIVYLDDLYTAFGDELKYFGDSQVTQYLPNADGEIDQWTGMDNDSVDNYLQAMGLSGAIDTLEDGAISMFQMGNMAVSPEDIHAVQMSALSHNSRPSFRDLTLFAKVNGVTTQNAWFLWEAGDRFFYKTMLKDPSTNAPWTVTGVNGTQVGVKMKINA